MSVHPKLPGLRGRYSGDRISLHIAADGDGYEAGQVLTGTYMGLNKKFVWIDPEGTSDAVFVQLPHVLKVTDPIAA